MTKEQLEDKSVNESTKLVYADSTFWVKCIGSGDGVPHTFIGLYAPNKEGVFLRCLYTESWAAGKIEATIDEKTGVLEMREVANSDLNGQLVLACNLKTIGTQHSIEPK